MEAMKTKPQRRRKTDKDWQQPYKRFEELGEQVYEAIYKMSDDDRDALLSALAKCDHTNCSWTIYAMRDLLADMVSVASIPRSVVSAKAILFRAKVRSGQR